MKPENIERAADLIESLGVTIIIGSLAAYVLGTLNSVDLCFSFLSAALITTPYRFLNVIAKG